MQFLSRTTRYCQLKLIFSYEKNEDYSQEMFNSDFDYII